MSNTARGKYMYDRQHPNIERIPMSNINQVPFKRILQASPRGNTESLGSLYDYPKTERSKGFPGLSFGGYN